MNVDEFIVFVHEQSKNCFFYWKLPLVLDLLFLNIYPIGPVYGIVTYTYRKIQPNEGKYTIHGSYGYRFSKKNGHEFLASSVSSLSSSRPFTFSSHTVEGEA